VLAVLETHPIQYHAPVYRRLVQDQGVPTTALYGSDYSVKGAVDREFGTRVRWDVDLLGGYESRFIRPGSQAPVTADVGELRAALRAIGPRAVLVTGYFGPFHRAAIVAALSLRAPVIFRAETTDHALRRGLVKRRARNLALRLLYGRFDAVCPIGTRSREHYARLGVPSTRMFDAPYDVDTSPFRTDEAARAELRGPTRRSLGIPDDAPVVLYSGKLSERKGVEDLAAAAAQLPGDAHILFVGDGELRGALESRLSASMGARAHFLGFRNQTELSPYFHASDLLVLPSRWSETWGLVDNGGLHPGLPGVGTGPVGCGPDLVVPGRPGAVVAVADARALAVAVGSALELRGETARERCRAHMARFSLDVAAAGVARAYRAVTA